MTQLEFISGMKKLGSYYFKELTNEQLVLWYDMFKDITYDVFDRAIQELSHESQYMPNANILFEKCSNVNKSDLCNIAQLMFDDGYFHRGVERLSDEQAHRNFDKTMMWLEKGIIPSFLKEDMQEYIFKNKQMKLEQSERLQIKC